MNNSKEVSRRDFLRIGGISTGVAIGSTLIKPIDKARALVGGNSNGFKYRDRSKRYPWWVKTVDNPTIEVDMNSTTQFSEINHCLAGITVQPNTKIEDITPPNFGLPKYLGGNEWKKLLQIEQDVIKENIKKNVPGFSLRDRALLDSAFSFFTFSTLRPRKRAYEIVAEMSANIKTPEQRGVKRWEGTEEEASDMLEAAGKAFGAEIVSFCAVEPKWMYDHVKFSSSVNEITINNGREEIYPERFKYVINLGKSLPLETCKRVPSNIGATGDRITMLQIQQAGLMLENFIKSLGYEARLLSAPWTPFHVSSGMGELGRINKVISPIYGANLRTWALITDIPLALDKPIDFGLQEFCKGCKVCARACPAEAIPLDDEPSWGNKEWQSTGKKAYHEDGVKCRSFWYKSGSWCAVCTVSCPWSRPIGSAMHDLSGPVGATIPRASYLLAEMHGVFGFGTQNDSNAQSEWWKLDLPPYGYGKFENK